MRALIDALVGFHTGIQGNVPEALGGVLFWRFPARADFSLAYADQNEKDHAAFDRAVRKGKVKAVFEKTR